MTAERGENGKWGKMVGKGRNYRHRHSPRRWRSTRTPRDAESAWDATGSSEARGHERGVLRVGRGAQSKRWRMECGNDAGRRCVDEDKVHERRARRQEWRQAEVWLLDDRRVRPGRLLERVAIVEKDDSDRYD